MAFLARTLMQKTLMQMQRTVVTGVTKQRMFRPLDRLGAATSVNQPFSIQNRYPRFYTSLTQQEQDDLDKFVKNELEDLANWNKNSNEAMEQEARAALWLDLKEGDWGDGDWGDFTAVVCHIYRMDGSCGAEFEGIFRSPDGRMIIVLEAKQTMTKEYVEEQAGRVTKLGKLIREVQKFKTLTKAGKDKIMDAMDGNETSKMLVRNNWAIWNTVAERITFPEEPVRKQGTTEEITGPIRIAMAAHNFPESIKNSCIARNIITLATSGSRFVVIDPLAKNQNNKNKTKQQPTKKKKPQQQQQQPKQKQKQQPKQQPKKSKHNNNNNNNNIPNQKPTTTTTDEKK